MTHLSRRTSLDQLTELAFSTLRLIRQRAEHNMTNMGRMRTLFFIGTRKSTTMKDIAEFLAITPPSTTTFIESLAKEKLVRRTVDPSDRRIVRISLTAQGTRYLKMHKERIAVHFKKIFGHLNDAEQKQFIHILKKLHGIYQK